MIWMGETVAFLLKCPVATALLFCSTGYAGHIAVLDTGTPPIPSSWSGNSLIGGTSHYQHLAGAISTDRAHVVDAVEAFLYSGRGLLTFAITGVDDDGLPDDSNVIHSATIVIARKGGSSHSWQGPTNLRWHLPAGDYWLALLPDIRFQHASMLGHAPHPTRTAIKSGTSSGAWHYSTWGSGWRVTAIPTPTPTAASLAALACVGALSRRRSWLWPATR
ncbi:hypothetical protein KOR34_45220 [Posidoniimonas corsicana]|uniref:Uncharacterized protein n=1 Tax=Posidoniimonas corsicana TaxID=1938618 RepID=A0A5C5UXQ0_9BACT|nr:hypothetical protein KOR34_45220 [Posidoniimonas corsicana]